MIRLPSQHTISRLLPRVYLVLAMCLLLIHSSVSGTWSTAASTETQSLTTFAPQAVSNVSCTWQSPTELAFMWERVDIPATGYSVYRGDFMAETEHLADLELINSAYKDENPNHATTSYVIRIRAAGYSGPATRISSDNCTKVVPAAPTNLSALVESGGQVTLSWAAVTSTYYSPVTGYRIFRDGTEVGTSSSTSFTETVSTETSTTYVYAVKAIGPGADSGFSNPIEVNNNLPANIASVTLAPSGNDLTATWPASSLATGYFVRTTVDGATSAEQSVTSLTFTFPAVPGSTSYVEVRAVNAEGTSPWQQSNIVVTKPSTPTGLDVSDITSTSAKITWDAVHGATDYTVTTTEGSCVVTGASAVCSGLASGQEHQVSVASTNAAGSSSSTSITFSTSTTIPTGLLVTDKTSTSITYVWDSNAAASYKVTLTPSNQICETSDLTCTFTALSPNTTYDAVLTSYPHGSNPNMPEANSSPVSTTTPPAAPVITSAASAPGNPQQVTITWDPVPGATSYTIDIYDGPNVESYTTTATSYTYVYTQPSGNGYTGEVRANNNANGNSAFTPFTAPPPNGVAVYNHTQTSARVAWAAVPNAASYKITCPTFTQTFIDQYYVDATGLGAGSLSNCTLTTTFTDNTQSSTNFTILTIPATPTTLTFAIFVNPQMYWGLNVGDVSNRASFTWQARYNHDGTTYTICDSATTVECIWNTGYQYDNVNTYTLLVSAKNASGASPYGPIFSQLPVGIVDYQTAGMVTVAYRAPQGNPAYYNRVYSYLGSYVLITQTDGNIVLYRRSDNVPVWSTGTYNLDGVWAQMQWDGNYVVYAPNPTRPIWASGTSGGPDYFLWVGEAGQLYIAQPGLVLIKSLR